MSSSRGKIRRKSDAAVGLAALRARKLSPARRRQIARLAARARWGRRKTAVPTDGRTIEEIAAELASQVPKEEWERLPADLTDHLDHYISPRKGSFS